MTWCLTGVTFLHYVLEQFVVVNQMSSWPTGNSVCHHIRYLYAIISAPGAHTGIRLQVMAHAIISLLELSLLVIGSYNIFRFVIILVVHVLLSFTIRYHECHYKHKKNKIKCNDLLNLNATKFGRHRSKNHGAIYLVNGFDAIKHDEIRTSAYKRAFIFMIICVINAI